MFASAIFAPAGLEQHPLSAAFPAMSPQDFDALRDSITDIGVQNPITIYEGMVLDGWHRYCAALEFGQACPTQDFGTDDPVCFVKAQNKARRHLPIGAWALIEVSLRKWKPAHRPEKRELSSPFRASNKDMADAVGVSERTIQQAKTVHTKAAPEVLEAVKRGEIGLPKAAAIAKLPVEEQAAAISPPLVKQAKALKAVKEPKAAPPAANDDQRYASGQVTLPPSGR
ncbi:ParB/RepB/Spo0J family partition protein, partial [Variovorax sp. WDL1]